MRIRRYLISAILLCMALGSMPADERKDPLDLYILLDRSLSMAEEKRFSEARAWVLSDIIEKVVIPGDRLYLIAFYGKTDLIWDGPIGGAADKRDLIRRLAALKPDGRWTDIGNALDVLKARLEKAAGDGRLKYILLVTDDKQEAPPGSPYFSPDGKFSHAYLTYTRIEEHGNWKAITLGVGIDAKVSSSVALLEGILTHLPGTEGSGSSKSGFASALGGLLPWALLVLLGLVLLLLALLVAKRLQSSKRQKEEEGGNAAEGSS